MPLQNIKLVLAAIYVAVIGAAGLAAGVTSPAAWAVLSGLAVLPAVALLTLWNHPTQTLSEAIEAARHEPAGRRR
jgi:hypothetical protein